MTISLITATYNSAATVADTLASIAGQHYSPIEHIIVDGMSKDKTLEIVGQFAHVSKIICERDNGIYDAMNKGIRTASGEVVGILNSDDVYAGSDVIGRVMEAFDDKSVDAAYGDLQYTRQHDLNRITRTWKAGSFDKNKFYSGWMPPHPSFFVRKSVYDHVGLFDLSLRSAADYEFMLRVLLKYEYPALYIPRVLVKMRAGGYSNATFANRLRANREDRKAWKLNGIKPRFFTTSFKPLRKVFQFIHKS